MSIKTDKETCIGCGTCVGMCPDIFELDEEGKARIKEEKDKDCAREAADACPAGAISMD